MMIVKGNENIEIISVLTDFNQYGGWDSEIGDESDEYRTGNLTAANVFDIKVYSQTAETSDITTPESRLDLFVKSRTFNRPINHLRSLYQTSVSDKIDRRS